MGAAGSSPAIVANGTVTVSGETVIDIDSTFRQYTASIIFRLDGTVDRVVNTTTSQRDAATDWIIPNGTSEQDDYEIRYTNHVGIVLTFASSGEDTWVDLDGDKTYRMQATLDDFEEESCSFTIEIRINGGAVIDSATYSLTIENLGF